MYWSNETPGRFLTADDCFFVTTRDEDWIKGVTTMLEEAFEELTLERGDTINILGMTVHMDRANKRASRDLQGI